MKARSECTSVPWKLGVEIELMAPHGRTRQDLAFAIAKNVGGRVRRIFYPQGEPSKVPGKLVFENLTLGFAVEDAQGKLVAQCVDDITLQGDLDRRCPPKPGWYRIVSDDSRLMRLIMRQANPEAQLSTVLSPIADLFGTTLEYGESGMVRLLDEGGASVAIGAPLPGERERPCELITAPIESDHFERLESLLRPARELDFGVPAEGAIHLHFNAARLCSAVAVANLVTALGTHGETLKNYFGTNTQCRRLGEWPKELFELVASPSFIHLPWDEARQQLAQLTLTKYCDFNLRNVVYSNPNKHTFEVRILPVWLDSQKIVEAATFFAAILNWACEKSEQRKEVPTSFDAFRNRIESHNY